MFSIQEEKITLGPILTINYLEKEGLNLKWNFCGTKPNKTYNSHCFILEKDNKNSQNQSLLQTYFSQLNLGDFFGVVRKSSRTLSGLKISWSEKIANHQIESDFITSKMCHERNDIEMIVKKVLEQICNRKGITMINILLNQQKREESSIYQLEQNLTTIIKQMRTFQQFAGTLVINIIHWEYLDNCINIESGLNLFARAVGEPKTLCAVLKKYCNSIKISKVKITMQLLSSGMFFGFSTAHSWTAEDFVTYSKTSYSVLNANYSDKIIFINSNTEANLNLELGFKLQAKFIDGNEMECTAKFKINESLQKIYCATTSISTSQQFDYLHLFGENILTNLCTQNHVMSISYEHAKKYNDKKKTNKACGKETEKKKTKIFCGKEL